MAGQDADAATYHPAGFDGVIPRAVRYIFEQVEERKTHAKYTIRASFLGAPQGLLGPSLRAGPNALAEPERVRCRQRSTTSR